MNKLRLLLILAFGILTTNSLEAQMEIYQWQTHLSYDRGVSLAETNDRVYFAPTVGLMYYDKRDGTSNVLSSASGLSDLNVGILRCDTHSDALFIGYSNANIDIIKGNEIINIPDIKNKDIVANKTINNIYFLHKYAYVCTGFGISAIDIQKEEVRDTYLIGENGGYVNVYGLTSDRKYFYAATDKGVYRADVNSNALFVSSSWTLIVDDATYTNVVSYADRVIVSKSNPVGDGRFVDEVYTILEDGTLEQVMEDEIFGKIYKLVISEDKLLIAADTKLRVYDGSLSLIYTPWTAVWTHMVDALISPIGYYFMASSSAGLIRCRADETSISYLSPNGPASNDVFRMTAFQDQIWVSAGGYTRTMANEYNRTGIYSYIDNKWNSYPAQPAYADYVCVAVSPSDSKRVFIGTYGGGVIEMYDGQYIKRYDETNSSLQQRLGKLGVCITGMAFDSNGDLWVANSQSDCVLHVMRKNGTWEAMDLGAPFSLSVTGPLVIDKQGQKWIVTQRTNNSIFIFSADGKKGKQLTSSPGNGALDGLVVTLAIDDNGEAWLGSDNGIFIISNPNNIFKGGNYDAKRVVYDGRYLFENTLVTAIAVDGGNKKWVGTDRSGVFLISPDGKEQIYEFNMKNSPLISDNLVAIAINNQGEVFFGTRSGIISYKDSTRPIDPDETEFELMIYPNPVSPDYAGSIAIDNLPPNGSVKITDAGGRLVYSVKAQGTRAVWDGNNFEGKRSATGVYFIQSVGEDTKQKAKGKIVFIN